MHFPVHFGFLPSRGEGKAIKMHKPLASLFNYRQRVRLPKRILSFILLFWFDAFACQLFYRFSKEEKLEGISRANFYEADQNVYIHFSCTFFYDGTNAAISLFTHTCKIKNKKKRFIIGQIKTKSRVPKLFVNMLTACLTKIVLSEKLLLLFTFLDTQFCCYCFVFKVCKSEFSRLKNLVAIWLKLSE